MITLEDVLAARERIRGDVEVTPCPRSWTFSDLCGASVYFKLESLQRTGSFKERGAANKLALLGPEERRRGVVAASAGNRAQGVAYNAQRLGVKSVIVMPETTPLIKVAATKSYGAQVVLCGTVFEDAYQEARRLESEKGYVFIHAFDDDEIIAGQGTAALELLEQVPGLDVRSGAGRRAVAEEGPRALGAVQGGLRRLGREHRRQPPVPHHRSGPGEGRPPRGAEVARPRPSRRSGRSVANCCGREGERARSAPRSGVRPGSDRRHGDRADPGNKGRIARRAARLGAGGEGVRGEPALESESQVRHHRSKD